MSGQERCISAIIACYKDAQAIPIMAQRLPELGRHIPCAPRSRLVRARERHRCGSAPSARCTGLARDEARCAGLRRSDNAR